jgi:hypothetical protein
MKLLGPITRQPVRYFVGAFGRFVQLESSSSIVLLLAATAALVLANSNFVPAYEALLNLPILVLNWLGVTHLGVYIGIGAALWWAVHASGLHATLTGILLALTSHSVLPFSPGLPCVLESRNSPAESRWLNYMRFPGSAASVLRYPFLSPVSLSPNESNTQSHE